MGITEFYDTEGRAGTTAVTVESLTTAVNTKNKYGVSELSLGKRYSLLDRI